MENANVYARNNDSACQFIPCVAKRNAKKTNRSLALLAKKEEHSNDASGSSHKHIYIYELTRFAYVI